MYTVPQVYKFYEMCQKEIYDESARIADIMYHAIACGTPADNKKASREQMRIWRRFRNGLDWSTIKGRASGRAKPDPLRAFRALGITPGRIGVIKDVKTVD